MGERDELESFCRMGGDTATSAAVWASLTYPHHLAVLFRHSEDQEPHLVFTFSYPCLWAAEPVGTRYVSG